MYSEQGVGAAQASVDPSFRAIGGVARNLADCVDEACPMHGTEAMEKARRVAESHHRAMQERQFQERRESLAQAILSYMLTRPEVYAVTKTAEFADHAVNLTDALLSKLGTRARLLAEADYTAKAPATRIVCPTHERSREAMQRAYEAQFEASRGVLREG